MGTDIHTVIELKVAGKWIGVCASDFSKDRPAYAERDYNFFAEIANVRGEGENHPKGFPADASDLSKYNYQIWQDDYDSASHMSLNKFCEIHNKIRSHQSRKEHAVWDLTGLDTDDDIEKRIVFWFDR